MSVLTRLMFAVNGINQRLRLRNEAGQATAEYGVVILIAVALGMAVLMLFTGGFFNGILGDLIKRVLSLASTGIKFT